jgi:hypothetical protein
MKKQHVLFIGATFFAGSSLFSMEQNAPLSLKRSSEIAIKAAVSKKIESEKKSRDGSPSSPVGCEGMFPGCGNLNDNYGRFELQKKHYYSEHWYAPYVPER